MKHIKTFKELASKGALAAIIASGLVGCSNNMDGNNANNAVVKQNATVFIEKTEQGYKIADEFPSNETRVFLREKDANGNVNERLLSQAEIDELVKAENAKIDAGTSNLTNGSALSSGGMSLGEAILASAAGAIIGSWIGSKLFNNPGYNAARSGAYSNPSAYSRSQSSFGGAKTGAAGSSAKSGFFGGSKTSSSTGSNSYGG